MGRDKDSSARKAGGRTAASSSAAAAMVAAMGAGSGLTFAAFDPNASSTEQDLDPEISLALKKLSKRDPTTKMKALGELLAFFQTESGRTEEELALVLPLWQQPFQTVTLDADRRVREALFVTLGALVVRVKKHMTKHVRGLMLPWLCARFDTEAPVRSAANAAFSALFPPAKIADALLYCKADILLGIDTNLAHTVQTLCDPKLYSKEEADETIARVHASSLLAFAHVLEALSAEQAANFGEVCSRVVCAALRVVGDQAVAMHAVQSACEMSAQGPNRCDSHCLCAGLGSLSSGLCSAGAQGTAQARLLEASGQWQRAREGGLLYGSARPCRAGPVGAAARQRGGRW